VFGSAYGIVQSLGEELGNLILFLPFVFYIEVQCSSSIYFDRSYPACVGRTATACAGASLCLPVQPVELCGRRCLVLSPLSTHREIHSVPSTPIRSNVLQSADIVLHYSSRVVIDGHL
jgi:hypothetical protein